MAHKGPSAAGFRQAEEQSKARSASRQRLQRAMEEAAGSRGPSAAGFRQVEEQQAAQSRQRARSAGIARAQGGWNQARAARAQRARQQAIQAANDRRRQADIARRQAASGPSVVDKLLGGNHIRQPGQPGGPGSDGFLLRGNRLNLGEPERPDALGSPAAGILGDPEIADPEAAMPGPSAAGFRQAEEQTKAKAKAEDKKGANTAGIPAGHTGVWNRVKRLESALEDPVFKAYYNRLLEYQGEAGAEDDLPLAGEDGGLFAESRKEEDKAFPALTENAPPFLMARDDAGEFRLYDAQDAFDEYQDDLQDPRAAGMLAFQLNAAGFYGFDSAESKRLMDRMLIRETGDGGQAYELQWGEEDDAALEAALKKTSQMQATAAEDGYQTDFKSLIEQQALKGLTHGQAASAAIEGGIPGVPKDLENLKPGNYGGYDIDSEQAGNLGVIAGVGRAMGMSERDIGIAIITSITESNIRSLGHGDRDSLGIFQQRPSQGWGSAAQVQDPNYAASKFFEALKGVKNRDSMSMGAVAQAVQKSAHPERYAKNVAVAAAILGGETFREYSAPIEMIGKVKPHALAAAQEISGAFGKDNIGGLAKGGHIEGSDHYTGEAIDVMGAEDGVAIANYATLNAERWGVKYVIHNRQIWTPKEGWKPYSGDNPHTGHVHVSFDGTGGTGTNTVMTAGQAAGRALGGTVSGSAGGTGGSGGSGGGALSTVPGAVSYADPTEVERAADSVALDRLGRELDEDEVTDVLNLFHNAQREYQSSASLGISAAQPDIMGMVEKFIDDKLTEESEGQMEGEFAVAAFKLLAGESGLTGVGI